MGEIVGEGWQALKEGRKKKSPVLEQQDCRFSCFSFFSVLSSL
jgi:hypothetical protein